MTEQQGMQAILLPGGILPASLAYAALLAAFGDDVDARPKELEVYSGEEVPPAGYGLETEVEGIDRTADEARFGRFHLVGYSAGGASSLAYAVTRPERLLSLTLSEPAWAGSDGMTRDEEVAFRRIIDTISLPPEQMLPAFARAQLAEGVEPPAPPPGPPPPWMATRPAGASAFASAFDRFPMSKAQFRAFPGPVLFVLGGRSNQDNYGRMAERLGASFPDFTLEVFDERHHFDPPHRTEPDRYARLLERHWRAAEERGN